MNSKPTTFRFILSDSCMEKLNEFTYTYHNLGRKEFKQAWNNWILKEENNKLIEAEKEYLTKMGFIGNVEEKMFLCVRFYLRKKKYINPLPTDKKEENKKRKVYTTLDKELFELIDTHIKTANPDKRPSKNFNEFCNENKDSIVKYVRENTIIEENKNTKEIIQDIMEKIKKYYKNKYYNMLSKRGKIEKA